MTESSTTLLIILLVFVGAYTVISLLVPRQYYDEEGKVIGKTKNK